MNQNIKIFGLFSLIIVSQIVYGQTNNKEIAKEKALEAVKLVDNGKFDEGIKLLEEAQNIDSEEFDYPYEIAYAYYAKSDFKSAVKVLEKIKTHKDVTALLFQLLGNSYDVLGKTDKAFEIYDEGLGRFPNSGALYLEKGNIYWGKQKYEKALSFYEKGIELDPKFPSNYYRATKIYCSSTEEVWGMIYGEIFMNLERNSKRTSEISKLLYDTYKSQIKITNETSFSVSFSQNASIDINNFTDSSKIKLPYGFGVYEPTLIFSLFGVKTIDINSLDLIRSNFIDNYSKKGFDKKYPNILFSYQKQVQLAGHIEAYNHWILMKGDEEEFNKWHSSNKDKWDRFIKWFGTNGLKINDANKFHSGQY